MKVLNLIVAAYLLCFNVSLAQNKDSKILRLLQKGHLSHASDTIDCVPLVYQRNDLPFVEVLIHGKKYNFLFDTGASVGMVSKEIAADLTIQASTIIEDVTGKKTKNDLVLVNLSLGSKMFSDILCVVGDTKQLTELTCLNIDGIIGANLINLYNWQIDPVENQICLSKKPFPIVNDAEAIPVFFTGNYLPILPIQIFGNQFYALMDYGFQGFFELNEGVVSNKNINKQAVWRGTGQYSIGFNAVSIGKINRALVDTIYMGSQALPHVPIIWSKQKPMFGASLLKRYVVTFNTGDGSITTQSGQLYLQPVSDSLVPRLALFPIQLGLNQTGQVEVKFVWQAETTRSIKVGQRVLKVNNKELNNLKPASWCELASEIQANSQLRVVIDIKGKPQEFVFERVVY